MTTQGIIYPGGQYFTPKPDSWLAQFIADTSVKTMFVSADGDNGAIIGTIQKSGSKFKVRQFKKPVRVNSTAKTIPAIIRDTIMASISSAVWDLRRRHVTNQEVLSTD